MAPASDDYSSVRDSLLRRPTATQADMRDSVLSHLEAHVQALDKTLAEFEKSIAPIIVAVPESNECLQGHPAKEPPRSDVEARLWVVASRINAASAQIARLGRNITKF